MSQTIRSCKMLQVCCEGKPRQVGSQHGTIAKAAIARSISFYQKLFQEKCRMDWEAVKTMASKYQPFLEFSFPDYVVEMQGVAEGASVAYEDILSLNVRTEIAFGAFSDGCTAFSWKGAEKSLLGQNWDWDTEQAENLICLKIKKEDGLSIQMITEAGIIGKIGLNNQKVGCTLNAIKAKGVSFSKIPCHLALRTVLESESKNAAIRTLERYGVASACHILVAGPTGGTGLECSHEDIQRLEMNPDGIVAHTNHYVLDHKSTVIEVSNWLPDTRFRLQRIEQLLSSTKEDQPSIDVMEQFLKDEVEGDGASICRALGKDKLATLFGIAMDLSHSRAHVSVGRPSSSTEVLLLDP